MPRQGGPDRVHRERGRGRDRVPGADPREHPRQERSEHAGRHDEGQRADG